MDGEMFCACVKTLLAPRLMSGDIVIMDNLPAHKVTGAREAIEAAGATLLFLPAYSPDFNPVEMAIAQIKAFLKKTAAHKGRTRHRNRKSHRCCDTAERKELLRHMRISQRYSVREFCSSAAIDMVFFGLTETVCGGKCAMRTGLPGTVRSP